MPDSTPAQTPASAPRAIWQKDTSAEAWVTRFTVGDDALWATRLLPYDALGTRAHAAALCAIGLLTAEEDAQIAAVLDDIRDDALAGRLVVTAEDEDCHSVIERVQHEDTTRSRQELLRNILSEELGLPQQAGLLVQRVLTHTWRGTKRQVDVLFGNVRDP